MADGPIEEVGQTTRSLISGLATNPFILASVVVNMSLIGLLYWNGVIAERERRTELELLYKNRTEVGELLLKCQKDGAAFVK